MIALADMRSFYCSCESVYKPHIRSQPVIVLSNNDGCIVAQNTFAKAIGLRRFQPYFQQKRLAEANKVHVFSSNYALYQNISDRIMRTLEVNTPRIFPYSIDECFIDMPTGQIPLKELKPFCQNLRRIIWKEQRITMGVSVAPTKVLSKLGQYATKAIPQINGVCVLTHPSQWQWLAVRTPVAEVWGVGRRLNVALTEMGVMNALQLSQLDLNVARSIGGLPLARTVRELNGISCIPTELEPPNKQQIICSRSFGTKLMLLEDVLQAVSSYAMRASEKLREQSCLTGYLSVWLMSGQHQRACLTDTASVNLPGGTEDARRLSREATAIVKRLYKPGRKYIKAGISLLDIRPKGAWQMDLMAKGDDPSSKEMHIVDQINDKYGKNTAILARQLGSNKYEMKQRFLSPSYLTQWSDIPKLKC